MIAGGHWATWQDHHRASSPEIVLEVASTVSHVAVFKASTSNILEPWVSEYGDNRMERRSVLALEPKGQLASPGGSGMALGGEV